MRSIILSSLGLLLGLIGWLTWLDGDHMWTMSVPAALSILALHDVLQRQHAVLRNFPVIGHLRYLMEAIRPEINQYFIESDTDGMPFNRITRSVVYQRAKRDLDTIPFGTQQDVDAPGYEWLGHSLYPRKPLEEDPRVLIGGPDCSRPYSAALLNISAMSFGSLSSNAILALGGGARRGGFYHNTGEGGISPHHLAPGGDLVWQIGTAYFGCRDATGNFDADRFAENAARDQVKMIEIKLSQGAKPGHGGILPGPKVTREIAEIRGVEPGVTVFSPPFHGAFRDASGCLDFVARLRELSGGKPVGIKLCLGRKDEFDEICRAMSRSGITPDFVTVDGGEGGTGAAPLEFANTVGSPLNDALSHVHGALLSQGVRDRLRIIASGKVTSGFRLASRMALGADLCNSARGMMLALGCIQALRCNNNTCPVGVATQDAGLAAGLDVAHKTGRVFNWQHETVRAFLELLAAAGLEHPAELGPEHIYRRVSATEVRSYAEIYPGIAARQDERSRVAA